MDFSVQFAQSCETYDAAMQTSDQHFAVGLQVEQSWEMQFRETDAEFSASMEESDGAFRIRFEEGIPTGELPLYTGEYEVTPKVTEQTLETAMRSMDSDVTIHAIPYYEVDNIYQGQTVIIGGS